MDVRTLEEFRHFDQEKMQKNCLFETKRLTCDLYCLEPDQSQKPHTHGDLDKIYIVLEGEGTFRIGDEESALEAGEAIMATAGAIHGVVNEGPERLVCLVFMAPHPRPPSG